MTASRSTGRCAVVTGCSRGIGAAICAALARQGADVAGIYRSDTDGARRAMEVVHNYGRQGIAFQGDTGVRDRVEEIADSVLTQWGRIDIWVNNAAALLVKPFLETTYDDWHTLLAANLHGYFYGCQAAAQRIRPGCEGRIINITSAADVLVVGGLSAYITAKGGIVALTKTIALELGNAALLLTRWGQGPSIPR